MYNLFTQEYTECKEKITALLALITIKASKHLNSFKINIMEKSKAFELIEFVWNNEKTDSYLRVNIAMYEAVKLAIISQMKFNKEDFHNIFSKFSGSYWFGVNANGKGYGENFYREAVTSGNISACQSYEAFCNIKPFIDSKGRRLCKGAMYRDNEKRYRVTGFDLDAKKVYLVGYAISEMYCVQWTSFMKDVGRLIVVLWRICAMVQNIMNTR